MESRSPHFLQVLGRHPGGGEGQRQCNRLAKNTTQTRAVGLGSASRTPDRQEVGLSEVLGACEYASS